MNKAIDETPIEKKKLNKKNKIIIIVCSVILAIALCVGIYFVYENSRKIDLITDTKTIEYGEIYTPNVADFIDAEKINDSYKIDDVIPNEDGKEYSAVGEYALHISAKNKDTKEIKVVVKDTIGPELSVPSSIDIMQGTDLASYDFKQYFKADDIAGVKDYVIDTSAVDVNAVGEYIVTVSISDYNGNETKKTFSCIVVASANENEEVTTEIVEKEDGTKQVVVKKTEKPKVKETTTAPSNNKKPSNKPSNSNNSSNKNNNSSSSNKPENKPTNPQKPTEKPIEEKHCTTNSNHSMSVGSIGKWFNTRNELQAYVDSVVDDWKTKRLNGKITLEEFNKYCPRGYECWSCSYCGKWTGNYKYKNNT